MEKSFFFVFIILSISIFLGKAQYYVAISGDDDNDGLPLFDISRQPPTTGYFVAEVNAWGGMDEVKMKI